jgi:hypothetical protein
VAPELHEQALRRLTEVTGLVPVEYPTTRQLNASPGERAADLNAAFADPRIRAIVATIGGDDQITVIPHLDPEAVRADPKPFVGYSDNTNLLSWLWSHGVAGFYGGSTQVHLGPGPAVDPVHAASLRAALLTGERLLITDPGESEDIGKKWEDPAALTEYGTRERTEPWVWAGPRRRVTGRTWGGCVEVLQWILAAGRFPADPAVLEGGVLLWRPAKISFQQRSSGTSSDYWASGVFWERWPPFSSRAHRRRTSSGNPPRPNAPLTGPSSATRRSGSSVSTIRRRWCVSVFPSATRVLNGFFPTAVRSPSTASVRRSGPTSGKCRHGQGNCNGRDDGQGPAGENRRAGPDQR